MIQHAIINKLLQTIRGNSFQTKLILPVQLTG